MRKLTFSSVVDAVLNRVGAFFANLFLRRLSTHAAAEDASYIAYIEEQIEQLQHQGRPLAAKRLAAHLEQLAGDDPTYESSTCFGRQLLADTFEVDTPALRGEPDNDAEPPRRRGRPKTGSDGRLSRSAD